MVQELIYTSLENGLLPGTRGFSTVAMTTGLPTPLRQLLESLSGYSHIYTGHDADYGKNPVAFSHLRSPQGDSILSKIAACDFDYTGRTNKLAHHWIISGERQLPICGPAELFRVPLAFCDAWTGDAAYLDKDRIKLADFQSIKEPSPQATAWSQTKVGEKGAAVLAQFFRNLPKSGAFMSQPAYVIFDPEECQPDKLALVAEAYTLLTPAERWQVTFSTYFTSIPIGMRCDWRFCLKEDAGFVRQRDRAVWVDLSTGAINNVTFDYSELMQAAITGQRPKVPMAPPKTAVAIIDLDFGASPQKEGRTPLRLRDHRPSEPPPSRYVPPVVEEPQKTIKPRLILLTAVVLSVALVGGGIWLILGEKKHSVTAVQAQSQEMIADEQSKSEESAVFPIKMPTNNYGNTVPATQEPLPAAPPPVVQSKPEPVEVEKPISAPTQKAEATPAEEARAEQAPKPTKPATYQYRWMTEFSKDTIPDAVKNKEEAMANTFTFYGIRENQNGEWTSEKGDYIPRHTKDNGNDVYSKYQLANNTERSLGDFIAVVLENDKAGIRYFFAKEWHKVSIKPVEVLYPQSKFTFDEFKQIDQSLVDTFNNLNVFSGRLYIGPANNADLLLDSIPHLIVTNGSMTVDYKERFISKIKATPKKYLPANSDYLVWFNKIQDKKQAITVAEWNYTNAVKAFKDERDKKIEYLEKDRKDLETEIRNDEKQKDPTKKIEKEIEEKREKINKRNKDISEVKAEYDKFEKPKREPVRKEENDLKKLEDQAFEKLKTLDGQVRVMLTLIPVAAQKR